MDATKGVEGYVKITLLTHEGGMLISKKILQRGVAKTPELPTEKEKKSPTLAACLDRNKDKLKEMRYDGYINRKQYDLLFPYGWENPNIDEWDLALIVKIVQKLFRKTLTEQESLDLDDIIQFRNDNICHVNIKQMYLSEHEFNCLWGRLTTRIKNLASNFDEETKKSFSNLENMYKKWPYDLPSAVDKLREVCRNDEHMEKVLTALERIEHGVVSANTKLDALKATHDTTNSTLEELHADVQYLKKCQDEKRPIDITIQFKLLIRGNKEEVVERAEEKVLKSFGAPINEADDPVKFEVNIVIDDIKKADAVDVSVKKGSIILTIKCPTLQSLEKILSLLRMNQRLHGLEKALSDMFQEQLEVDLVLTANTIKMLRIWIDGCLNATPNLQVGDMPCTRTLSMAIQCHSAEAVTKVVNYFHSKESAKQLNQLSEALSKVVQDEVRVDVQLDTKGFLEDFKTSYETEIMKQEQSRRDAEARTSDTESSPQNVQNETEIMKQEQSRRDAEARTSDIECGPENVQIETEIMKQEQSRRDAEARTSDIEYGPENIQNETETMTQEQSRRDAEARTSDIESGPENVQNETEIMKQEQSRRDAEARTSDSECGPENVQTSMSDRFEDERYISWLKLSLAVGYTNEALESFTDREVLTFHNQLKASILGPHGTAPPKCCSPTCTPEQLKTKWFKKDKDQNRKFVCPNNVCDKWIECILKHHAFEKPNVVWGNADISQLPLVPWECMKLFLPFGNQQKSTVQEFDLVALLSLYLDCRHFDNFFADPVIPCQDICKQVKEVRNRVMHSGQMKVDTAELHRDVATIKALLQDPQHLINDPDCQEGVRKLDKLMAGKLELSLNKALELRILHSKMLALENKVEQMQDEYEDISNELQTVSGDVEALRKHTAGNQTMGEEIQQFKQDIIELKNNVDVFTNFMKTHGVQGVDTSRLMQCESKLASLSQRVEQKLKQHEQKLLQHDQTLHQHGQKHLKHDQTLQHYGQRLEGLEKREKPANTFGIECSPEDVQHVRQTLLSLYERRFKQISVFPEEKVDLEDLYVDQELSVIKQCGKSGTKEKNDQKKKTINTVKEIFYKDGKICENILISSEPGLGKSIFCKRLVRLWYQGQTLCETDRTEDQSAMRAFEILFYIDLKELKEDDIPPDVPSFDEIAPTIYKLLDLKRVCQEDYIHTLLEKTSTLVVMDSLDEIGTTRVPHRGLHNNSCIVITSRPWKIEALRSHLTDINQHIEIVGLAQNSQEYLADKVIKLLNNGSSPTKTGVEFMRDIKTNKLQDFLNNPLLLIKMVCIWLNGESVGKSQFKIYSQLMHYQICSAVETKPLLRDVDMGSGSERNLSFCSKPDPCPCRKYGMLMRKVAQLAYHTLFNKEGKMCLVFDHKKIKIYELSTKEIELCSKIGILTQRKFEVEDPFEKKKTVSFPHKTNQEYFAAIFLSGEGQQSDLDRIRSVVSDLDRALELDKVLLFCSENNTAVAAQLSHLISEIADENPRVQEYRQSCYSYGPHADLIEKIQNIIIPATQQNTQLFLSDIIIQDDEGPQWRRFEGQDRKHFIHYLDLTIIKSLGISAHATDELLQSLKLCNHLLKLVVCDSGIKVEDIHEIVVRNTATLITLLLAGGKYGGKPLDILTLGPQWGDMLTANLSSLGLNGVKLSHEQCQDLSTFVATTNNLKQVKLERISCETHGDYERAKCFMLDLRRNINLHTVVLSDLPVEDVLLHAHSLRSCKISLPRRVNAQTSIFTALKDASALQELTCVHINDTTSIFLFLDILPNFNNLQRIELWHVEFGDVDNVCLSATMKKLKVVRLNSCTITSAGLRCLIKSLPNHKVKVKLDCVIVTDDEKIFQEIRDSPNTNITWDHGVEKMGDGWMAGILYFDNNNTRPGQA